MVVKIFFNLLGILIFAFLFWRKEKEDYLPNQIFTTFFLILLGVSLFLLISKFFLPGAWFWLSMLGFMAGFFLSALKLGLRIYETLEAALASVLPWLSFSYLSDSITSTSWFSLIGFGITLGTFFLYLSLNTRYKNFSWYKSGRIGFAGLTSIGIYFLIRGLIAIFFPFVLSFVGDFEPILSGIAAFAFFSMVFNLSRI